MSRNCHVRDFVLSAEVLVLPNTMTSQPTKQKLWGGRFTGKTDPLYAGIEALLLTFTDMILACYRMHAFNQSLKYDRRMHAADIQGSIAYAKALTLIGILTKEEETKIIDGLTVVGTEWNHGVVRCLSALMAFIHGL